MENEKRLNKIVKILQERSKGEVELSISHIASMLIIFDRTTRRVELLKTESGIYMLLSLGGHGSGLVDVQKLTDSNHDYVLEGNVFEEHTRKEEQLLVTKLFISGRKKDEIDKAVVSRDDIERLYQDGRIWRATEIFDEEDTMVSIFPKDFGIRRFKK